MVTVVVPMLVAQGLQNLMSLVSMLSLLRNKRKKIEEREIKHTYLTLKLNEKHISVEKNKTKHERVHL